MGDTIQKVETEISNKEKKCEKDSDCKSNAVEPHSTSTPTDIVCNKLDEQNIEAVFTKRSELEKNNEEIDKSSKPQIIIDESTDITTQNTENANEDVKSNVSLKHCKSSNIFSTTPVPPDALFSFRGVPTKQHAHRARPNENSLNQTDSSSIKSKSSINSDYSSNSKISRNVLTGEGVISHDEYTGRRNRRVDGNPLLGVGYKTAQEAFHSASNNPRIPPGGWSKGLW